MNSSVLQFSLGLTTGSFLRNISEAGGAVKGFIGSMIGVGAITEGVMAAIEKGSLLEQLHRRTSASIADIYQLQKGFKAAGVDSENVSSSLFQMQKALGGVNEAGEDTKSIFYRMGLSVDDLKKQNAPEQIDAILTALNGLGTSDAAKAASSIFGRMNAQNMIQIAHSSEEFSAAIAASADSAKNWQRIAPLFERVHLAMEKIKTLGMNLFAGIAEGVAPALLAAAEYLQTFEVWLKHIGEVIRDVLKGLVEMMREGKLSEALKLTFQAGIEYAVNLLQGTLGSSSFWSGMWNVMVGAFKLAMGEVMAVLEVFFATEMSGLDYVVDHFREAMGGAIGEVAKKGAALLSPLAGPIAGPLLKAGVDAAINSQKGYKAPDFSVRYQENEKYLNNLFGRFGSSNLIFSGTNNLMKGAADIGNAVKDGFGKANAGGLAAQQLKNFWDGLLLRSPAYPESKKIGFNKTDDLLATSHYKPEFTAFEKMGFVMGGAGNPLLAPTQRTANNTDRMVHALEKLVNAGHGDMAENKI